MADPVRAHSGAHRHSQPAYAGSYRRDRWPLRRRHARYGLRVRQAAVDARAQVLLCENRLGAPPRRPVCSSAGHANRHTDQLTKFPGFRHHNSPCYEFPGGLEPGETQQLSLAPNTFSAWGKVPDEAVKGSVLELKLIAFEDASGKKLGTPETDDTAGRKKALEEGIRTLENKIQ